MLPNAAIGPSNSTSCQLSLIKANSRISQDTMTMDPPSTVLTAGWRWTSRASERRAAIGEISRARNDGTMADTIVTPTPTIAPQMKVAGSRRRSLPGGANSNLDKSQRSVQPSPMPVAIPTTVLNSATIAASPRSAVVTCRPVAPMARSRSTSVRTE